MINLWYMLVTNDIERISRFCRTELSTRVGSGRVIAQTDGQFSWRISECDDQMYNSSNFGVQNDAQRASKISQQNRVPSFLAGIPLANRWHRKHLMLRWIQGAVLHRVFVGQDG